MMSGDEFYDDDVTSGILHRADFIRDELKDSFPCGRCGARQPARLGRDRDGVYGCSECLDYQKCGICKRWTFIEDGTKNQFGCQGHLACYLCRRDVSDGDYLNVDFAKDGIQHICSVCWEKRDTDYLEERLDNTDD